VQHHVLTRDSISPRLLPRLGDSTTGLLLLMLSVHLLLPVPSLEDPREKHG
jgi:hypothetical protein